MLQANNITSDQTRLPPTHQANNFTTDSNITNLQLPTFLQTL